MIMSRTLHISDDNLVLSLQGLRWLEKIERQSYQSKEPVYSLCYAYKGEPKTYVYGEGIDAKNKRDSMFDAVKSALIKE